MYSGPLSTPYRCRLFPPLDDPIEAPDLALGWQREVDLDAQPFAVEVVQHVQQPKRTTIFQPIGPEIH